MTVITLRPAHAGETDHIRTLWQRSLGGREQSLNCFFDGAYAPENALLLLEDNKIQSLLYLLPITLHSPGQPPLRAHCIYALETAPEARGKGFGRRLLKEADSYLGTCNDDCLVAVPANPGLHKYFGLAGFDECFSTRMEEVPETLLPSAPAGGLCLPIPPEEYTQLREQYLTDGPYAAYSVDMICYQERLAHLSGGGLYRLDCSGGSGCAVAQYTGGDSVLIKELLFPHADPAPAIGLLARAMPAQYYTIRSPAFRSGHPGSYIQPCGMAHWYNLAAAKHWKRERMAYLGPEF